MPVRALFSDGIKLLALSNISATPQIILYSRTRRLPTPASRSRWWRRFLGWFGSPVIGAIETGALKLKANPGSKESFECPLFALGTFR